MQSTVLSRGWLPTKPSGHWIFGLPKSGTTVFAAALSEVTASSALLDTPLLWGTAIRPLEQAEMKALVFAHPVTFSPRLWKEPNATFYPEAAMAASEVIIVIFCSFGRSKHSLAHGSWTGRRQVRGLAALHPNHRPAFLGQPSSMTLARRWQETHLCWHASRGSSAHLRSFHGQPSGMLASAEHLGLPVLHEPVRSLAKQHQPRGANRNVRPEAFFGERLPKSRASPQARSNKSRATTPQLTHNEVTHKIECF